MCHGYLNQQQRKRSIFSDWWSVNIAPSHLKTAILVDESSYCIHHKYVLF